MHGRLKVKSTAEQQEAKRKEREKKLQLYTAATTKAFTKRKNNEYDEEALKTTGEILSINPDFYTLWNFRKEIFTNLKEKKNVEDLQKLYEEELYFLESCLKVNPKSYGTWHHRSFALDNMPCTDWARELQLCNKFLEYDDRNFHCWDYRRFVIKRSNVSPQQELEFTIKKISNNFSNYSSWHYRSKLLPLIYPEPVSAVGVQEDALLEEFETVQNAFFTDPDDQSAWFYHRWLLGRGQKNLDINCVYFSRLSTQLFVSITQPLLVGLEFNLSVKLNDADVPGDWNAVAGSKTFSTLWIFQAVKWNVADSGQMCISVTLIGPTVDITRQVILTKDDSESWADGSVKPGTLFSHELSAARASVLERELESVRELYDLEQDNKWALLTLVLLMKALDPLQHEGEILKHLNKLQTIDTKRKAYYKDLKSRIIMENCLETLKPGDRRLELAQCSLTVVYHTELMTLLTDADLSSNQLTSLKGFGYLQCLQRLCVDSNNITDLTGLDGSPQLLELSVQNNLISQMEVIQSLCHCTNLQVLRIAGNPMCRLNHYATSIKLLLPCLLQIDGQKLS